MAYAVIADLIARFGERELIQLTDRSTPPSDGIDNTVAQPALDSASVLIDGYVAAKYALPLQSAPPLLVDLNCDIARYRLYADQAPEQVKDRYKEAVATLSKISRGEVKIDAGAVEPPSRATVILAQSDERRTDRHSLRDF